MAESAGAVHVEFTASTANVRAEMDKGRAAVRGFGEETKRAMSGVHGSGGAIGDMGGQFGKLGDQVKGASASIGAFSQLGALLGNAVSPAVKGLGSAVSALMMGGFTPLGLAIGAATAIVAVFAKRQQDASAEAEKHTAKLKEQADALDRVRDAAQGARDKLASATGGGALDLIALDRKIKREDYKLTAGVGSDAEQAARAKELETLKAQREEIVDRIEAEKQLAAEIERRRMVERIVERSGSLPSSEQVNVPMWLTRPAESLAAAEKQIAALSAFEAQQLDLIETLKLRSQAEAAIAAQDREDLARQKARNAALDAGTEAERKSIQDAEAAYDERQRIRIEENYAESFFASQMEEAQARQAMAAGETVEWMGEVVEKTKKAAKELQEVAATDPREAAVRGGSFGGGFGAGLSLKLERDLQTMGQIGANVAASLADNFSNAFAAFATGAESAKEAMKSFARSFLSDVASMITRQMALNLVAGVAGMFGAATTATAGSYTNASLSYGGDVGSPPIAASMALPASSREAASMAPTVNVYPQPGESASVSQSDGPGGPSIDIVIERVVAGSISRGGNVAKAMEGRYGVQRQSRRA